MNYTKKRTLALLLLLTTSSSLNSLSISDVMPTSDDWRFIFRAVIVFGAVQLYSPLSTKISRAIYGPTQKEQLAEEATKNEIIKYVAALPEVTKELKDKVEQSRKDHEERLNKRISRVPENNSMSAQEKEKLLKELKAELKKITKMPRALSMILILRLLNQ